MKLLQKIDTAFFETQCILHIAHSTFTQCTLLRSLLMFCYLCTSYLSVRFL